MDPRERLLLESLDTLLQGDAVRAGIRPLVEQVRRKLAQDRAAPMAWASIPLPVYGRPLPEPIQSSWVFILRARTATGAERHPNSHQRMVSYQGSGDLQTGGEGQWQSNPLISEASAPLEQRCISVPPNVWHQAVVSDQDWVVVSFHTVPAEDLVEERPHAGDVSRTRQRRYLACSEETDAPELRIRHATEADLPVIVDIYNQSIPAGWSTADTKPIVVADRVEWFRKFDPAKRPIWVVEVDGRVVGTVYLSSFYGGRPAYDATAEVSIYLATAYHRRGIGRHLKQWVIEQCPRLGVTTLLSMHFDHNEATRRINESLGFEQCGHLKEIAVVQGRKRGLILWALRIPPQVTPSP
jgi:L-amino acid N-acyltransferase YncA